MLNHSHLYEPVVYPEPDWDRSVLFIGDMHIDCYDSSWLDPVLADLATMGTPLCYFQIGDQTDNKASSDFATHDAQALAWLDQLKTDWHVACGNHDSYANERTVADWEAAYNTLRNDVIDLGPFQIVKIGPDEQQDDNDTISIPDDTVTWLGDQLAATTKPCIVACHAPLINTVLGERKSTSGSVWAVQCPSTGDDTPIRTVLEDNDNVFAYVSGHTHTAIHEVGFVTPLVLGSRVLSAPNCTSVYYAGHEPPQVAWDPLRTIVVTIPEGNDRVEVRVRDHRAGKWVGSWRLPAISTTVVV